MVIDLQYQQGGMLKKLTVAVWYPTSAKTKMYQYGGPTWGNVALNAEPISVAGKYTFHALPWSQGEKQQTRRQDYERTL